MVIMYGQVLLATLSIIINVKPNSKWLGYNINEQLNDIFPYFLASLVMFAGIRLVNLIEIGIWPKLFLEILVGICLYFWIAVILKLSALKTVIDLLKKLF
jgi:hypothetical protein